MVAAVSRARAANAWPKAPPLPTRNRSALAAEAMIAESFGATDAKAAGAAARKSCSTSSGGHFEARQFSQLHRTDHLEEHDTNTKRTDSTTVIDASISADSRAANTLIETVDSKGEHPASNARTAFYQKCCGLHAGHLGQLASTFVTLGLCLSCRQELTLGCTMAASWHSNMLCTWTAAGTKTFDRFDRCAFGTEL